MKHQFVHDLFSSVAEKHRTRPAIEGVDRQITYDELETRSNNLANFLIESGASIGSLVAILVENRIEAISSILGILKAGCTFVPLDPTFPEKRVEVVISEVSPEWFVSEVKHLKMIGDIAAKSGLKPQVICVDADQSNVTWGPHLNYRSDFPSFFNSARPNLELDPDSICSIYFTSGSTGRPKGIAGRLKGIDHFIKWEIRTLRIAQGTRVSQLTSPSFDGFLKDVFVPLCAGGTVCVPASREIILDGEMLVEWIDSKRINLLNCVPSVFRTILNQGLNSLHFSDLKHVLLAGEQLLPSDVKRWMDVFGDRVQLVNLYGPTETTVTKFFHLVTRADIARPSVPIGKPMEGAAAIIVDPRGKPCTRGVIGEIYIRTPYRALGYYRRPELTSEVFIPNPLSRDPNDIVYKTGDFGRIIEDGNFEFLGRRDQQVKIRGVRVELGEIESLLSAHESVKGVAVIDREDSNGNKYLCAYVVLDDQAELDELRKHLASYLPEYMLPSAFVALDALPRTLNGKVDRKALPTLEQVESRRTGKFIAPRNLVEEILAGIWAQALGLPKIGVRDNFFEFGGHSLLATQIMSRVRETFALELPLRALFEAPTIESLSREIETAMKANGASSAPPVKSISRDGALPLSFAQQRLWFLDQLEPANAAYHMPYYLHLTGALNVFALEQGVMEIVRRHEMLRTIFPESGGHPAQIILESPAIDLPVVDLRGLENAARDAQCIRIATETAHLPFDLTRGPLFRAHLVHLGEDDFVLSFNLHHIVTDGWSLGILTRELGQLYSSFSLGGVAGLEELSVQYADFASWQHEWLNSQSMTAQLDYWKNHLNGALPLLNIPTSNARPVTKDFRGAHRIVTLSGSLAQSLRKLGRLEGCTTNMILLTAFKQLLHMLTRQGNIILGLVIANRNRSEIENLIGFFVNMLAIRSNVSGDLSFHELLRHVRDNCLEAYQHQDLPFEKLVAELQPQRNLDQNPIIEVLFNNITAPAKPLELPGLTLRPIDQGEPHTHFPLTFYVNERDSEISLKLTYRKALFSSESISTLLDQYQYLLEQILTDPHRPIGSYSLVVPGSESLFPDLNSDLIGPRYEPVTVMFERTAGRNEDLPAIRQGGEDWTFGELAQSARRIAQHLVARSVRPRDVVAVFGPSSFGLVSATVGTLLSGGVLLLVDRSLPAERQKLFLQQAEARYLIHVGARLTEHGWLSDLPSLTIIQVDPEDASFQGAKVERELDAIALPNLSPEDPAYIFFTSGSTGTPKAVLGWHNGLSHFIAWQQSQFSVGRSDRCAQLTQLSFDVVLRELFLPLTSGATLCLPDEPDGLSAEQTLAWLEREKISILHAVPTLAESWLAHAPSHVSLKSLRWVFFAGEALKESLVNRWRKVFPQAGGMVNLYGPTETTLAKCWFEVPRDVAPGIQPIGRPMPYAQAVIMKDRDKLCGIGEPGEIVIRTPYRTLGYLSRDTQDSADKKFVPNPFRHDERDLIYFTGDLGWLRPDGLIEIQGRVDNQVKIRGVRIETEEVAAVLSEHAAVRTCVVTAAANEHGETALLAYVVPAKGKEVSGSELRAHLIRFLPTAAIPSHWVFLERLPMLPNGKVDRRSLPSAQLKVIPASSELIATARDAIEEILAGIWSQVLGIEDVGINQDFFDLGGHSLLATQALSRIREAFNIALPLRCLFEAPTIEGLAQKIRMTRQTQADIVIEPIQGRTGRSSAPLSFAQQRMWFLNAVDHNNPNFNIPCGVRLAGLLNIEALEQTLNEITRRHESLRTNFGLSDEHPVQIISSPRNLSMPVVDLSSLPREDRDTLVWGLTTNEARRPFDLQRDPLIRATLLRLDEDEHAVALTMHHIVSDHWSLGILIDEVAQLYPAFFHGSRSTLPELAIQYADYAAWERTRLVGEALELRLNYWRDKLDNLTPLELVPGRHAERTVAAQGRWSPFWLEKELTEKLKSLARCEGATLSMTLLAAFNVLLYRYSGQTDLAVGVGVANRGRVEIEKLIGFFVNMLVLRSSLSGSMTFRDLLRQVREMSMEAFDYQDIPFDRLVNELKPERHTNLMPFFQVAFFFQNAPRSAFSLPHLTLIPQGYDKTRSHYDLVLELWDTGEMLRGGFEYDATLFDAGTISQMLYHLRLILQEVVERQDTRLIDIALPDPGQEVESDISPAQIYDEAELFDFQL